MVDILPEIEVKEGEALPDGTIHLDDLKVPLETDAAPLDAVMKAHVGVVEAQPGLDDKTVLDENPAEIVGAPVENPGTERLVKAQDATNSKGVKTPEIPSAKNPLTTQKLPPHKISVEGEMGLLTTRSIGHLPILQTDGK